MANKKTLSIIHFASTGWLVMCISYLVILSLRQAGVGWWVIFSLSGYSAVIMLLLLSIYIVAVFRGAVRSNEPEEEHPLSSTIAYAILYSFIPLLGGIAGALSNYEYVGIKQFAVQIAMSSLAVTFIMWIIIDPLVGMIEIALPKPRKHRTERLEKARAKRLKEQQDREKLLVELEELEKTEIAYRHEILKPKAQKLADLLINFDTDNEIQIEQKATDLGVEAWQIGGMVCMKQLKEIAMDICHHDHPNRYIIDRITIWWDGIGDWRAPAVHLN